jgi:hypothetical protein
MTPNLSVKTTRRLNFKLKAEKGIYFGYLAVKDGSATVQLVPMNSRQEGKIELSPLEEEAV